MSASKFSDAEASNFWRIGLQCMLLDRVDEAELSAHLGMQIEETRTILAALIEIGFYDPVTQSMDPSMLPPMKWSAPMTGEEFDAHVQTICGKGKFS